MSSILDYIIWRGDIPMDAAPFNEVDGLILSHLALIRWEKGLKKDDAETLAALYPALKEPPVAVGFTEESDQKLLALTAESVRFGSLTVSDFVWVFEDVMSIQFAALTFHLPDGTRLIVFRGTDSTLVGWREDFALAFSKPIPAQDAACVYLARIAKKYPGKLRLAGHSKGGNLAMYAAANAEDDILERIIGVYNYDGPGFSDKIDAASLYMRLGDRLETYLPQGSIVGILLTHPENYAVVKSDAISIWQHYPYTWQVLGGKFICLPALSRDSARLDVVFQRWISTVEEPDRELLVYSLFDVLEATNASNFGREFWQSLVRNPMAVIAAIHRVEPAQRKRMNRMLLDLAAEMIKNGEKQIDGEASPQGG